MVNVVASKKKKEIALSFCATGATTGIKTAWGSTAISSMKMTLSNGKKPTYNIKKDFSNLSMRNIYALLKVYNEYIEGKQLLEHH
jgi:hypothetical protein